MLSTRIKEIAELLKKGATVDAQKEIMNLREEAIELQEENIELREKMKKLEEEVKIKRNIKWIEPYYVIEDDGKSEGQYCQRCYDSSKKLIRLQELRVGMWKCLEFKNVFRGRNYQSKLVKQLEGGGVLLKELHDIRN